MKKEKRFNNKKNVNEFRINDELSCYEMLRLVYKEKNFETTENDFSKIVTYFEAKRLSEEYELDLVEINGSVTPPIVKLCDYNKFLFDLKKNGKDKKKNNNTCKEIQLSTNISQHDLYIKVKKAKEFIKDGDKVKVVLTMRGRELTRRELSKECFETFIDLMSDVATPENLPKDEGNKAIVILKRK